MRGLYDATLGRWFTAWYGFAMRLVDEFGLRETRRAVISQALGRTLDIGTGTGANLPLYPAEVTRLVLAKPDSHMQGALRRRIHEEGRSNVELVQAPAEHLPFANASFDSVVCTMVLCTIPDPTSALVEVARVLRPGGQLLFLEHVRSEDPGFARWQDRLEKIWRFLADGCHCNRDSLRTIEGSAFQITTLERGQMPLAPLFMKPLIYGAAVLPE